MNPTNLESEFRQAVIDYRTAIIVTFHSRHGDRMDRELPMKKILDLYKSGTSEEKEKLLAIATDVLSDKIQVIEDSGLYDAQLSSKRLNTWLSQLSATLASELRAA